MHRMLTWTSKGGTSKTTTVANLGPEIAGQGYDVLLVGFDPQGDLEATYGIPDDDPDITRIEQLLATDTDPTTAAIEIPLKGLPKSGRLRLLPSSPRLLSISNALGRRGFTDLDHLLTRFHDVDLALIDTQGALTPISQTAVTAADSIVFSMEPGYYEYRALASRLGELEALRDGPDPTDVAILGVLFARTSERSRQMREYRAHFTDPEAFGTPLHVFKTHIRQQASVRDHPRLGLPTVLAEPTSNVAKDYRKFARELTKTIAATGARA